jgi:hypothetical protein
VSFSDGSSFTIGVGGPNTCTQFTFPARSVTWTQIEVTDGFSNGWREVEVWNPEPGTSGPAFGCDHTNRLEDENGLPL